MCCIYTIAHWRGEGSGGGHYKKKHYDLCACRVGCGGNGDRSHQHDSIRDAVFSAAQSAALKPRKEVPSLIPGTQSRPADIFLPNWRRGRLASLDVTVISTLQQLTLQGAASSPGYALAVGKERKRASHAEACHSVGVNFIPLVVESLGGWSKEAADTISSIGRLLGQRWESLLVNLSDTFSSNVLYLYGEATRPSGFVVILFILRQLMVSYD